ncbi:hypothetical protein JXA32_01640 [Candidatus Sumerlaeota bacterium]|nr:hypothetical protein [Candidatus Sumerlaeota bacterium]
MNVSPDEMSYNATRRQAWRPIAACLLLGVMLAALSGCSRIYMETSPFGEKQEYRVDTRKTANRVNGWPLFYQRAENVSVLWPLYQQDDKGFALYPLFEYAADPPTYDAALYLIHHQNNNGKVHNRVLPFWWYTGDEEKSMWNFMLLASGERKGPYRNHRVFPIYNYEENKEGFGLTYVLLGWCDFKEQSLEHGFAPLYYYKSSPDDWGFFTMIAGAGGKGQDETFNYCLPLWFYLHDKEGVCLFSWPYTQVQGDGFVLRSAFFPLTFYWKDEVCKGHAVAPLYFYERDLDDKDVRFISPLFARYEDDGFHAQCYLGPLYYEQREGERYYQSVAFPLFHRWGDGDERTLLAPPLIYRRVNETAKESLTITPLCFAKRDGEDLNVIGPVGGMKRSKNDGNYNNLLGLLYHHWWDDDDYFAFLTPLAGCGRSQWKDHKENYSWIFPLFFSSRTMQQDAVRSRTLLTPLYSRTKSKDYFDWNLGIILAGGTKAPLYKSYRSLLSLIEYTRKQDGDWSFHAIPFIGMDQNGFTTLLSSLHSNIPDQEELEADLLSARGLATKIPDDGRVMQTANTIEDFTIFSNEGAGYLCYYKNWRALLLASGETTHRYTVHTSDTLEQALDSLEVEKEFKIWPIHKHESNSNYAKTRTLFGLLWRSDIWRETVDGESMVHADRRFLWKFYDEEQRGDVRSADIFPFITLDRDASREYRQFSFLGPVLRRTRQAEKIQWRILGLKIGPEIELIEETADYPKRKAGEI